MKNITRSTASLMIMTIGINANTITDAFEKATVNGYIRAAYQMHDLKEEKLQKHGAVGGKLHIETAPVAGISLGSSFYTSSLLGSADSRGLIPFRGESSNSYTILGEAYLKALWGKSTLTLGRQEIETPFAQVDDIGMVPNTFEAYMLENRDIPDTTLYAGQIQKMAGVDAEVVEAFTPLNGSHNMQLLGATWEGIPDLTLSTWYYRLKDAEIDSIAYIEATYETDLDALHLSTGLQYAKETYLTDKDASVYGVSGGVGYGDTGVTLRAAYNKARGNTAFSGFGGGPFFSNSDYLIIDNADKEGSQRWVGMEWDGGSVGIEGLTVSLSKATLKTENNLKATEVDFDISYEINDQMEVHMISSDIDGANVGEDTAKHLRVFGNYRF